MMKTDASMLRQSPNGKRVQFCLSFNSAPLPQPSKAQHERIRPQGDHFFTSVELFEKEDATLYLPHPPPPIGGAAGPPPRPKPRKRPPPGGLGGAWPLPGLP